MVREKQKSRRKNAVTVSCKPRTESSRGRERNVGGRAKRKRKKVRKKTTSKQEQRTTLRVNRDHMKPTYNDGSRQWERCVRLTAAAAAAATAARGPGSPSVCVRCRALLCLLFTNQYLMYGSVPPLLPSPPRRCLLLPPLLLASAATPLLLGFSVEGELEATSYLALMA